MSEELF